MTTLIKYAQLDEHFIAQIVDEDGKTLGYTVMDRNEQRKTSQTWNTASGAIDYALENDKGILDD